MRNQPLELEDQRKRDAGTAGYDSLSVEVNDDFLYEDPDEQFAPAPPSPQEVRKLLKP